MSYDEHSTAVRNMLRRVQLSKLDDSGSQQLASVTGLAGDAPGKVVRLQHAGLSSTPSTDAEGVLLSMGGRSDKAWVLGLEHPKHRPTGLPGGATALYDEAGNIIKLIGESVTMTFKGHAWSAECKGFTLTSDGADIVLDSKGAKVYLGGKSGAVAVMTASGPSSKVFAVV